MAQPWRHGATMQRKAPLNSSPVQQKNPRESRYFSQSTDQSTCYRRELLGIHEKTKSLKTLSGPAVSCGCFPRRRISFLRIAGAIGDGLGTCFPSGNSLGQAVKSWVLDNPDGTVHWFLEILFWSQNKKAGWWFGTCFIFPHIGNDNPN